MAEVRSGSFTTTGYSNSGWPDRLIFSWSLKSQDITNNRSVISFTVKGSGGANGYRYTVLNNASATVAGSKYSKTSAVNLYNDTVIFSGDVTINHNANGTGSFSASVSSALLYTSTNSTGSGSWALPTIPRASSISSISNDGMVINGSNALTVNISRKSSAFTHTVNFTFGSRTHSATGQRTNCTYIIPLSWIDTFGSGGSGSKTGTVSVQTYNGSVAIGSAVTKNITLKCPDASVISSSTGSIICDGNNAIQVSISRSISSFKHKVTWDFYSNNYAVSNVDTSTSYTIPTSWLNAIPNHVAAVGTVMVETFYGTQKIGKTASKSFALGVPDYTPTFKVLTVKPVQPSSISTWDIYVQNTSEASFNFNEVTSNYGATIASYKITINNQTFTSNDGVIKVPLPASGFISYTATVMDTRSKMKSISGKLDVKPLVYPKFTGCSFNRYDGSTISDEGTQVRSRIAFSYESYDERNDITEKSIYIKPQSSSDYTKYGTFTNNTISIINDYTFDINKAYDITVVVTDTLGHSIIYNTIIPTAYAVIDISDTGHGIGLLKMSSKDGFVEVGGCLEVNEKLTINQTSYQAFRIAGTGGAVEWYCLGTLVSSGDSQITIIDVYSGNGYNGEARQNTYIKIFIKDGWQSSASTTKAFGISYEIFGNNSDSVSVKGLASANNKVAIWVKFPWGYHDGHYEVHGIFYSWTNSGTKQTAEPTDGTTQECIRKYPILDKSYLPLTGGTVIGTLTLSKTNDASGAADNKPALIVGNESTSTHIEMDGNEIMAKSNGTTPSALYINNDGGNVIIGSGGLAVKGDITTTSSSMVKAERFGFFNDKQGVISSRTGGGFDFWLDYTNTNAIVRIVFDTNGKIYTVSKSGVWTIIAQ